MIQQKTPLLEKIVDFNQGLSSLTKQRQQEDRAVFEALEQLKDTIEEFCDCLAR